jgi:hypothetical protein
MKSPKTKFVVISAIGLVSIVGIFVFAQSPTPTPNDQDFPVQLMMRKCAHLDRARLMCALGPLPENTYRIRYDNENPIGTLPDISPTPRPCPDTHLVGNATQRAMFKNTQELHAFLDTSGL